MRWTYMRSMFKVNDVMDSPQNIRILCFHLHKIVDSAKGRPQYSSRSSKIRLFSASPILHWHPKMSVQWTLRFPSSPGVRAKNL